MKRCGFFVYKKYISSQLLASFSP